MLAKTWYIHRIFNSPSLNQPRSVFGGSLRYGNLRFIVLVIVGIFLLISLIECFAGGIIQPKVVQNQYIPADEIQVCQSPTRAVTLTMTAIYNVYSIALLLAACILAFRTRLVDSAYNESRYVSITAYLLLQLIFIFESMIYILGSYSGKTTFFVSVVWDLMLCYVVGALLLLPKVIAIESEKHIPGNLHEDLDGDERDLIAMPIVRDEDGGNQDDVLVLRDAHRRNYDDLEYFSDSEEEQLFRDALDPRHRKIQAAGPSAEVNGAGQGELPGASLVQGLPRNKLD